MMSSVSSFPSIRLIPVNPASLRAPRVKFDVVMKMPRARGSLASRPSPLADGL